MVERVIQAARASLLDEVVLVYQNENIKKAGEKYGIKTVFNERADEGQSASIKIGIEAASSDQMDSCFWWVTSPLLMQQPLIY